MTGSVWKLRMFAFIVVNRSSGVYWFINHFSHEYVNGTRRANNEQERPTIVGYARKDGGLEV
jgi:hypothetical protein